MADLKAAPGPSLKLLRFTDVKTLSKLLFQAFSLLNELGFLKVHNLC